MSNYNPTHNPNESTDPAVHIYDSRENCVRSPADGSELPVECTTTVSRLFASEAPIAFDGEWVYLSVRVSDGTSRSQTCYAVIEAAPLDSATDLEMHVSSALTGTDLQFSAADRDQLAYVCQFLDQYDDAAPPDAFDLLVTRSETTRCGAPSYEAALAAFDQALSVGEPLVVSRQTSALEDDVDAPLGAKNIVVVNERLDGFAWSASTEALIDQLRTARREQRIEEAVRPIDDVVSDLRQLGLDNEAIQKRVSDRLPAAETEVNGSHWRSLLPFHGTRSDQSPGADSKESTRSQDSDSATDASKTSTSTSSRQNTTTNNRPSATTQSASDQGEHSESMTETFGGDGNSSSLYSSSRLKAIILALAIGGSIIGTAAVFLGLSPGNRPNTSELIPTVTPSLPSVTPPIVLLILTGVATVLFVGIVLANR